MNKLTTIMLGAVMLAGCQTHKPHLVECSCPEPEHTEHEQDLAFFSEERDRTPAVKSILARQMDNGAAADGLLRTAHFDGTALNSLGTDKLDAMIRGTREGQPVSVYLDLPENDERLAACEEAVVAYLAAKGIEEDRILVQAGDNPATRHLATLTASKRYEVKERTIGSAELANEPADSQQQSMIRQSNNPVPARR